jgi:cell division protein FtsB
MESDFYRKKKKRFDIGGKVRRLLKNRRLVLGLLVGIPVLAYVLFGSRGVVQRVRLQRQKTELEAEIRAAETETKNLQAESKALDGDEKAIEKVAREKHDMVREGETVYKVNKSK